MTVPCIVIDRHKAGFYEWSVLYGHETMGGDLGDPSIASCLSSALAGMPGEERLIEVRYRGLHMGTFETNQVLECTDGIATKIAALHAALTRGHHSTLLMD
jgi:hypothetical protein